MFEIFRSLSESDRINDFVAIGNLIEDGIDHAAFVINHDQCLFEFHYTGEKIEFEELYNDYYHKITNTILPEEVPAFVALCNEIKNKANPIYGFFYSGEYYDSNFDHVSTNGLGERMTCVGFCLNMFKTFLEEDYIQYSDWNADGERWKEYLLKYCEKNGLNPDQVSNSLRRITPRECLTSCFFVNLPITKKEIDSQVQYVNFHISMRNISKN